MSSNKEDNFTKFILTRYLYVYDEVGLSFVESILTHKSLDETLFWISELYHSGYSQKSWELLWFVYLDFYFVTYPTFIKYLKQKHKTFSFPALLSVVYNLHAFKRITPFVFLLRLLSCNRIKMKNPIQQSVYKGRKPAWLLEHFPHASMHHFIRDLFTHRYESLVCHSLPEIDAWKQDEGHNTMLFISSIQTYYQVKPCVMESLTQLLHFSISEETETETKTETKTEIETETETEIETENDIKDDDDESEEMEEENEKNEEENEEDNDCNEHDVDMVDEMSYKPYNNYRHVLLAIVCLFEFSREKMEEKTEENIPDILQEENETKEENSYLQFLDKDFKIPNTSPAWSPKYIQKFYKNHSYMQWTQDTFTRKTIYLGIPKNIIDKFEIDQPVPIECGTFPSFATSDNIIPFILSREAHDYDIIDLWRKKWLYFASRSPLWYTRLSEYNFVISHADYTLKILSDDDIESFHSTYPYDPDEAGEDVVDKVIPDLFQEHKLIDWLNIVIPNQQLCQNCYGNSRFAVYLKYHTNALLHHDHIWF